MRQYCFCVITEMLQFQYEVLNPELSGLPLRKVFEDGLVCLMLCVIIVTEKQECMSLIHEKKGRLCFKADFKRMDGV